VSRRFAGQASAALVVVALCAAPLAGGAPADPPHTGAQLLGLAENELAATERAFWNPRLHWYDWRLTKAKQAKPLASLWAVFPLFELVDAVAIASPTPAHEAAVETIARGAEAYLDPYTGPPSFTTYPGLTNPAQHVYFDDDGWFEIAFLDAYRATGERRFLRDAEEAYRFIAEKGWDPDGGGFWWETLHRHLTSEPLAAEIDTGLRLYEITGEQRYLTSSEQWLAWANAHSWNASERLYQRNPTDGTTMDYVEGPMIGARLELCKIRHIRGRCTGAEQLAAASLAAFGTDLDWTPVADALYLRFVLQLYATDHRAGWLALAQRNADDALEHARDADGLFFRRWNGGAFPTRLLQPDAATLSLFAWIAAFTHG
jgi:hypothetical protein